MHSCIRVMITLIFIAIVLIHPAGTGYAASGTTTRANVSSAGGEVIAFASDASNLVASDTNFTANVFDHDSSSGQVNAPPAVDAGPAVVGVEGTPLALNGSVTDTDSPDVNIQWSVTPDGGTSGSCTVADPSAATTTALCDDDGSYTATLTADDDVNPPVSDTATLPVGNVAPVVDAGPDTAITTGDTFSGSGSFSDPGADSWSATVDYGDGDDVQLLALAPGNSFDLSNTYLSAGVYTVTVTIMDDDTGTGSDSLLVSVTDAPPPPVAPVITALNPDTVEANYADDLPLLIDGSGFDAHTTLNWNGTVLGTELVSPTQLSALVPVSLLVSTDDFEVVPVTVNNTAGTSNTLPFTIYGPLVTEIETALAGPGQTVTVSTAPTTLGDSGLKATLVRAPAAGGPAIITAVSYPTDPLFPIDPLLPDGFGFVDLRYDALPPNPIHADDSISADFYLPPKPVQPGDPYSPPNPVRLMYWTGTVWSTVLGSGGASPVVDLTANLDGTASLGRVSVTFDSTSAPAITALGGTVFGFIEVANQAPVATITGPAPGALYPVGTSVQFSGSFTDAGDSGSHTAGWSFGSISVPGTVIESGGSGTVSATYSFTAPGIYPVTLSVSDEDGAVGEATTVGDLEAFVVVYDPSGGFVTGGGWITSPEGAYAADPSLSGKATFGFVARYKKGASVPNGNTEFQFKAGDLSFASTSYDWLIVAGARAQFKGTGMINGTGNYGFLLTAIDGQQNGGGGSDRFRIKIWDKNNGDAIVYDNQTGANDYDDPTTVLGGGSIVIHKFK